MQKNGEIMANPKFLKHYESDKVIHTSLLKMYKRIKSRRQKVKYRKLMMKNVKVMLANQEKETS